MLAEGLNIDVCSGGELAVALAGGADPARLGFHGNNKSLAEIDEAVAARNRHDRHRQPDRDRARRCGRRPARPVQSVRLRVNSGVHAHTHSFLATAHEDQKFGVALEDAPRLVAAIRAHAEPRLPRPALPHRLADLRRRRVRRVGRPSARGARRAAGRRPRSRAEPRRRFRHRIHDRRHPDPDRGVRRAHRRHRGRRVRQARGIPVPAIAFEPGRAIIGSAGVTLYEVGTTKPTSRSAIEPARRGRASTSASTAA